MNKKSQLRTILVLCCVGAAIILALGVYFIGVNGQNARDDFKRDCVSYGYQVVEIGRSLWCENDGEEVVTYK